MDDADFRRHARRLLLAWAALLLLLLSSLGSAYIPLGWGNPAAGIVIAVVKSAIVVTLFMELTRANIAARIAAVVALVVWLLLIALSGVDYTTRPDEPAKYQPPQQLMTLTTTNGFDQTCARIRCLSCGTTCGTKPPQRPTTDNGLTDGAC